VCGIKIMIDELHHVFRQVLALSLKQALKRVLEALHQRLKSVSNESTHSESVGVLLDVQTDECIDVEMDSLITRNSDRRVGLG
jgi:hypothetical protein